MSNSELKIGDRVFLKGYIKEVQVEGVDELLTSMLNRTHYLGVDVDYLDGKSKTTNCEPFTIEEAINQNQEDG